MQVGVVALLKWALEASFSGLVAALAVGLLLAWLFNRLFNQAMEINRSMFNTAQESWLKALDTINNNFCSALTRLEQREAECRQERRDNENQLFAAADRLSEGVANLKGRLSKDKEG